MTTDWTDFSSNYLLSLVQHHRRAKQNKSFFFSLSLEIFALSLLLWRWCDQLDYHRWWYRRSSFRRTLFNWFKWEEFRSRILTLLWWKHQFVKQLTKDIWHKAHSTICIDTHTHIYIEREKYMYKIKSVNRSPLIRRREKKEEHDGESMTSEMDIEKKKKRFQSRFNSLSKIFADCCKAEDGRCDN